jgi:hypothetical protein
MMDDTQRLDWLEKTHHVLCYDDGEWFCAWRGKPPSFDWFDRPMGKTIREAIDMAAKTVEGE